jgi:3-hydroxybutyryl-CoA dehydrogenase
MDLIGIDVNFAAASSVYEGFFQDPRFRPHPIQRAMVESGRLGRKSGRGYYEYGTDGKVVGSAGDAAEGGSDAAVIRQVVLLGADGQPDVAAMAARLEGLGIRAIAAGPDAHEERATREADALIDLEPGWHPARTERLRRYGRWLRDGRPILACAETTSATALAGSLDSLAGPARLTGFTLLPPWGERTVVECFAPLGADDAGRSTASSTWSALGSDAIWFEDTVAGVLPRTVACLANEAAFAVMDGTAGEEAVDEAMRLGTRYPRGPLEWAREVGLARIVGILESLAREHGEDRYRVAPWLRRRVEAGPG